MTDTRRRLNAEQVLAISQTRTPAVLIAAAGTAERRTHLEDKAFVELVTLATRLNLGSDVVFGAEFGPITTSTPTTSMKGPIAP